MTVKQLVTILFFFLTTFILSLILKITNGYADIKTLYAISAVMLFTLIFGFYLLVSVIISIARKKE